MSLRRGRRPIGVTATATMALALAGVGTAQAETTLPDDAVVVAVEEGSTETQEDDATDAPSEPATSADAADATGAAGTSAAVVPFEADVRLLSDVIPDRVLREALVRGLPGVSYSEDLTMGDISAATYFTGAAGVTDLTGLDELPALTRIGMSTSIRLDLSVLGSLPNLSGLNLTVSQDVDLTPLAAAPALTSVQIGGPVLDLSPLAQNAAIEYIGLDDNSTMTDLDDLVGSSATSLSISRIPLTDITAVATMTGLEYLGLLDVGTGLSDLSPVAGLPALLVLDVYGSSVADLSPLSGLDSLRYLTITRSQISDLTPLAGLALDYLELYGNQVSDLTALAGMPLQDGLAVEGQRVTLPAAVVGEATTDAVVDLAGAVTAVDDEGAGPVAEGLTWTYDTVGTHSLTWSVEQSVGGVVVGLFSGSVTQEVTEAAVDPEPTPDPDPAPVDPEPTPDVTPEASPVPGATDTGGATTTAAAISTRASRVLAVTGSTVAPMLAVGGALLLAGAGLVLARRRRA